MAQEDKSASAITIIPAHTHIRVKLMPLKTWLSRARAPGERPFAVIKRVFNAGYVLLTTVERVRVKMVFSCFCFNLVQLGTLAARS